MNLPRTVFLGVVGGALVAWLASAGTSGTRPIEPLRPSKTTTAELKGAELAAEIARLHNRLHPTTPPEQPERNLFKFGSSAAQQVALAPPAPAPEPAAAPVVPQAPPLTLIGVAEDADVRTAIISGLGQLFLVKEGERVADRYTVTRIDPAGVDLLDATDSRTIQLTLK